MERPQFSTTEGCALAGSLLAVASAQGHRPSDMQLPLVRGLCTLMLGIPDPDTVQPVAPADLAAALSDPVQREFAAQMLVLVSLVDPRPDARCTEASETFCRGLGKRPENLALLHEVTHRRIRRSRHHLFRRFLVDSIRTGSLRGDALRIRHMIAETHDHPEIAAPYLALADAPEDTFGNHFYWFYRHRGFKFPGEQGGLPTAYGFEVHDAAHLLSGYNTDPRDEINVLAFQAGATSRLPWLIVAVNMVTFNSGLAYGPTHLLHYQPHEDNLDPAEFVRALDRGSRVRRDLSGDFDLHAAWRLPIAELREQLGIEPDAADVRIPT